MRTFLALALAFGMWAGCSCGKDASPWTADAKAECVENADCDANECCNGGACGACSVGEGEGEADIAVSPPELDFESPLLDVPTSRELTVSNVGDADLDVASLIIDETGAQDFVVDAASKGGFTLPPGASRIVTVTLVWTDPEPPQGTLVITSANDPDERITNVPLTSEWKGTPALAACAILEGAKSPFKDGSCGELDEPGDPASNHEDDLVQFGTVLYDAEETRRVALWNAAEGNVPLHLASVAVTSAMVSFSLTRVNALGDEVPLTLGSEGRDLSPGGVSTLPEVVWVTLTLSGDAPGPFAGEDLQVTWEGESGEVTTEIPLAALVSCENGFVDVDGVAANGCECGPVADEVCDAEDNDCNGVADDGLLLGDPCDGPDDADACAEGWLVCADDGTTTCEDPTGESLDLCYSPDLWIRAHLPGGGGAATVDGKTLAGSIGLEGPAGRVASGSAVLTSGFWHVLP